MSWYSSRMVWKSACVSLLVGCASNGQTNPENAANLPCHVDITSQISLRSAESVDEVRVSIHGTPCHDAELLITISDHSGVQLYHYVAAFKPHTVYQWNDPQLPTAASNFARQAVESANVTISSNLRPFDDLHKEFDGIAFETPLSRAEYERIRMATRPVFTHLTGYESWRTIVFDETLRHAVVVLDWGM